MMPRRTHGHKRILCRAFHDGVGCPASGAGSPHGRFERRARNHRVCVEVAAPFAYCCFYVLEMLWGVTGLNVAAPGFIGFDLDNVGPEVLVGPQGLDGDSITLSGFRMIWT